MKNNNTLGWLAYIIIGTILFASLLLLGVDSKTMSDSTFILTKVLGLLGLLAAGKAYIWCDKRDIMPKSLDLDNEDENL